MAVRRRDRDSMKTGVTYWMIGGFGGQVAVAEAADQAKQMGYEAIELCYGVGELLPTTTEHELKEIRKTLEKVGLPLASLTTGQYWESSLTGPTERERADALAFTKAYIKAAHFLGTDAVLVLPGCVDVAWAPSRAVVPVADVYRRAREALEKLLPFAEKRGVVLCLENVWNKFLTGPFEMANIIDSFNSPFIKAYFDVGNCLINGYPEHWITVLGSRIERIHFKNFTCRDGGGTLTDFTGSLLKGSANWQAIFAELKSIGYDGYTTAEVIVSDSGMPDLEQARRVCQEMVQLVEKYDHR